MRDVLRGTLGASLRGMGEEDRLAAAWTVACGSAMAGHGRVAGYEDGVVRIEVADAVWLRQMTALSRTLERELEKISGLKVSGIEFAKKRNTEEHREHRSKAVTKTGA